MRKNDTNCPKCRRSKKISITIACGRSITRLRFGVARVAAHRHRRLERRHEQGRQRRPRRKRVDGLVFARRAAAVHSDRREPRRSRTGERLSRARPIDLLQAVEREAWDGKWYRRAYFDDGTPIGSSKNDECQIDSLAQSWAVLAGADPQRANQAMRSVEEHLIRTNDRLVLLLEPPFDKSNPEPRLHQRLSARHPRKRRAVHARGNVGRAGARSARPWHAGGQTVRSAQSDSVLGERIGSRPLSRRTVRRGSRRLQQPAARRSRRLDLVHGFGGLDVSRRRGIDSGTSIAGRSTHAGTLHSERMGRL